MNGVATNLEVSERSGERRRVAGVRTLGAMRVGAAVVGMVLCATFVACGPPPKPTELSQLEAMRNDSYTGTISQKEPDLLDKADKFYKMAVTSWQEGDEPRAKEYAWLGQLRYRTAEARTRTSEEREREAKAAELVREKQQEIEVVKVQIEAAQKSISQLEQMIAAAGDAKGVQKKAQAEQVVLSVEAEREKAKAVGAPELAAGPFNLAERTLGLAQEHLKAGRYDDAMKEAEAAKVSFAEAFAAAKPEFDKSQAAMARAEREKALFDAAQKAFSVNAFQDQRGVVVVMPRLFDEKKTTPADGTQYQIQQAAEIAKNFPETTIMVEGYTQSKGSDSKNLTTSQSRADVVRDYLVSAGVDPKRLVSTGYGEEKPRYDNNSRDDRGKNDRVELVFIMTRN